MSKTSKRFLAWFLCVCFCFMSTTFQIMAMEVADNLNTIVKQSRLNEVFVDEFYATNLTIGLERDVAVSSIKKAKDFAGNDYLIVEGFPEGYLIYNVNSGRIAEKSPFNHSPYYGKDGEFIYAGITYYYEKIGDKYYHLQENEIISENDIACNKWNSGCKKLQSYYESAPNVALLSYVNHGQKNSYALQSQKAVQAAKSDYRQMNSLRATPWSFYNFFYNLKDCGYISGGKCGFIALAMLYAAWDAKGYNNLVLDTHFTSTRKTGLKGTLATEMYNLAPKSSTTAIHISKVSDLYAAKHHVEIHPIWYLAPIANWNSVGEILNNTGRPLIIFGNLTGTGNHAVVGYYTPPARQYIVCHKGWTNETYILWDGLIGSYYYMEPNGA